MGSIVRTWAPNRVTVHGTTAVATWAVLGTNGTLYASIAACIAAGTTPFPGLGPGIDPQCSSFSAENGAGALASAVYFATNRATAPTDDTADILLPGMTADWTGPLYNVWFRKTVAGDETVATVMY